MADHESVYWLPVSQRESTSMMTTDAIRKLGFGRKQTLLLVLISAAAISVPPASGQETSVPVAALPATPSAAPEFDVASIKENKTADRHAGSHIYNSWTNGKLSAVNVPLQILIQVSTGMPESRIIGGPRS